jgi:molybdenum cofactor cytidylyltransferase
MTLAADLGVADRELVAFTGGGGKTSLLLRLADELVVRAPVLVTTTTKLGIDQTAEWAVCWSEAEAAAAVRDAPERPVCLCASREGHKVGGPTPERVDQLYRSGIAPYVLVEADGSRRRPLKAPAAHEPVVPDTASLVIVVVGIDAVGASYVEAAHRPAEAVRLTGAGLHDQVSVEAVASIVTHPGGGLKGIPEAARAVVAVTKVGEATADLAQKLQALVAGCERFDRVVLVPWCSSDGDPQRSFRKISD